MRKLFSSFERFGLEYLLISGQATVLYGAAMFSEDVDLWIRPTLENARKLMSSLAERSGRVHRLTPPLTLRNMRTGHGFHFVIPARPLDIYLDIMARPPRVGTFGASMNRARSIPTDWGIIRVVHPIDLVEIKKTRRLADYDIITNLVSLYVAEMVEPARAVLRWAAKNSFRPEERAAFLARIGRRRTVRQCAIEIAKEVMNLQAQDRSYWSPIIDELRTMRRNDRLLPDGVPVSRLP